MRQRTALAIRLDLPGSASLAVITSPLTDYALTDHPHNSLFHSFRGYLLLSEVSLRYQYERTFAERAAAGG